MENINKIIQRATKLETITNAPILKYLTIYQDNEGRTQSAFTFSKEQALFKSLGIKDNESINYFLQRKYGETAMILYCALAGIDIPLPF